MVLAQIASFFFIFFLLITIRFNRKEEHGFWFWVFAFFTAVAGSFALVGLFAITVTH